MSFYLLSKNTVSIVSYHLYCLYHFKMSYSLYFQYFNSFSCNCRLYYVLIFLNSYIFSFILFLCYTFIPFYH